MGVPLRVDGRDVVVPDDAGTLLDALREHLRLTVVKDGCSPQGQCGCCTVLVDGSPRVACVTPVQRVAGRTVTTYNGLDDGVQKAWSDALVSTGGTQCGFCTPGIVVRLASLVDPTPDQVAQSLLAHLCRCTGWRTIVEAADRINEPVEGGVQRDLAAAAIRATLEGHATQVVGPHVAGGSAGFADDSAPADALVAIPDPNGGWAIGETLSEARTRAGKVQGRRSPGSPKPPIELPEGPWTTRLRTSWVEPAYLEPDSAWCRPGAAPIGPLTNGGAFGGKVDSVAGVAARDLADQHGRPVRVVLAREDVVRLGPKRPPMAVGIDASGAGVVRVRRTAGIAAIIAAHAERVGLRLEIEETELAGPPTSSSLRGAGWAEIAVVAAARTGRAEAVAPGGGAAEATLGARGVKLSVDCGRPLDAVVARSYAIGAAHMGLGWVWSEGIAMGDDGRPQDLTIRSFGILRARDMPDVDVSLRASDAEPVNGSDASFAAVAAAAWMGEGLPVDWPTRRTS